MKFTQPPHRKRVRIVDIDGTICVKAEPDNYDQVRPLPYAVEMLKYWASQGDYIVLWTARPSEIREFTVKQLSEWGVPYNELLMDKPYSHSMHIYDDNNPVVHYVGRNKGIGHVVQLAYLYKHGIDMLIDPLRGDEYGMDAREGLAVLEKVEQDPQKHLLFPEKIYEDD